MASFNKIKVGDVLWDCRRQAMGNTTMGRMANWTVKVLELDPEKRKARCSWNGNAPDWWSEWRLSRLRRTPVKSRT